jgi:single-stranded-DNA-specific exonuclease
VPKFGGHALAAGLSLQPQRFEEFRAAFAAEIAQRAGPDSLQGWILTDGELERPLLSMATALALRAAGPWGQGFPEPLFDGEFDIVDSRLVGERHLKLRLRAATGCETLDAILFGHVGGASEAHDVGRGARVRLAYRLEVNEWNGMEKIQLNCQYLEPA